MSQNRKLYRSSHKVFGGVCAGLAEYFGIDIAIVRVVYTFLTVFTAFSGVLAYIIMWIVIPDER